METAENLAAPPSPALALPNHRRHLDSVTYRTLTCLFSRCLHLRSSDQPPRKNNELSRNPDGGLPSRQGDGKPEGSQITEAAEKTLTLPERDLGLSGEQLVSSVSEREPITQAENDKGSSVHRLLNDLEMELDKEECTVDGLQDMLVSDFAVLLDGLVDVANEKPPPESLATNCELNIIGKDAKQKLRVVPPSIAMDIKPQNNEEVRETEKCSEQISTVENENGACSDPVLDTTVSKLGEKQMSSLEGDLGDEDFEEGEISFDSQTIAEFLDSDSKNSRDSKERLGESRHEEDEFDDPAYSGGLVLEDNRNLSTLPENNAKCKSACGISLLPKDKLMELTIEKDGNQDIAKDNNNDNDVCRKRIRVRATEEKKAKKKMAKKRKRAQMDREQGVKRLKLQSIAKPKPVKYCMYYLKGNCHHGDKCKFSHDCTPPPKSKACGFFANDTCLKGDDCTFDHDLSKYPCHKFAEGACNRGDKCKFSHKVPETSDAAPTAPNLSVKPKMTSKPATKKPLFPKSMHPEPDSTKNSMKLPTKIPSGIRILSFGGGSPTCSIKPHDNRDTEVIKTDHQTAFRNQKSIDGDPSKNTPFAAGLKGSSEIAVSSCGMPQNELSDACKILDEFLFGV